MKTACLLLGERPNIVFRIDEEDVMRRLSVLLLTALMGLAFCGVAEAQKAGLKISIGRSDVDLANRTIYFKLNKPAETAELKAYDLDGNLVGEQIETYQGAAAGKRLSISWPFLSGDPDNFRIELKVTDVNEYWASFEIVHFYGLIPHEEVVFESGKSEIRPSEAPKLDAALPLIVEMLRKFQRFSTQLTYSLYIAGHTDTVGSAADNAQLSLDRARAIARYFQEGGLKKEKISIFIRGFGESSLAVPTKDNVDELRNRRADYIISNFPPAMPGTGSWIAIQK
jgi:outer membrane protein OmpA-like peptidoglycan-associated protein